MIELFFVTCLIGQPDHCTPHSLLFEERNGLFTCMLEGQNELARWLADHPDETVIRWVCRKAGTADTEI